MRTACRKFLDTLHYPDGRPIPVHHGMFHGGYPEWVFTTALGELRGVIGVLVAELAAKYHVDVDGDLASILPDDTDADSSDGRDDEDFWEQMP